MFLAFLHFAGDLNTLGMHSNRNFNRDVQWNSCKVKRNYPSLPRNSERARAEWIKGDNFEEFTKSKQVVNKIKQIPTYSVLGSPYYAGTEDRERRK